MYIYPHNSLWTSEYAHESKAIMLSYDEDIELHHIGSTAVEGLVAKDCIDILGIVTNLTKVQTKKNRLVRLGYVYKGEYGIYRREYFSKSNRKVHLHLFESGDINILKHLNFVKVMKNTPDLVVQLNDLKNNLHNKYPNDKDRYQREKAPFYNEIHKTTSCKRMNK